MMSSLTTTQDRDTRLTSTNQSVAELIESAKNEGVQFDLLQDGVRFITGRDNERWRSKLEQHQDAIYCYMIGLPPEQTGNLLLKPISASDLIQSYPERRQPIIHGVCRRGETVNIIGAAKAGKSWLIHGMLLAVATGREWLDFATEQGRVLIVDNELHPEELSNRLDRIAREMGISQETLNDSVDVLSLRGRLVAIDRLSQLLLMMKDRNYSLIGLDAFYRVLPSGISENDNAAMANIYNQIDHFASELNCGLVLNHHSSKGDQSGKSVTDVGSGAGSISRSADTHLILRTHAIESCAVLEGVCRSFPPVQPISIRWQFPLWHSTMIEPELNRPKGNLQVAQEKRDRESDVAIIEALSRDGRLTRCELRSKTGFGNDRVARTLARLVDTKTIQMLRVKHRVTMKKRELYEVVKVGA